MFRNLSVKARLASIMGLLAVMLTAIGVMGVSGMSKTADSLRTVYEDRLVPTGQLAEIRRLMQENRLALASSQATPSPEFSKTQSALMDQNKNEIDRVWTAFMSTYLTAEEKTLAEQFIQRRNKFVREGLFPSMSALRAGRAEEGTRIAVDVVRPTFAAANESMNALLQLQLDVAKKEYAGAVARYESSRNLTIGVIVLGLLMAAAAAYFLIQAIVRPLNEAVSVADAVAAGDLTRVIDADSTNETGRLMHALKRMNENLGALVTQVRSGVDTISIGSQQIAAGNADLSQRTEEQASSLEQTASSMEELTSTVKQNAENARHANQLAAGASEVAVKGGAVVSQVVQTMSSINESSKKIVDIISVIDGIAFQTNILALNAAVEAARAGEQGRGFAVVATEVRTLAQRSAAAAKEIKGLISDSVHKVESGTQLVDHAGKTMEEIVVSVKRVTDIMAEISAASQEQSSGIEQVNQAVTQMDEVTQQNAALVEEAAAAAESMQEQAKSLTEAVSIFRLAGTGERVALTPRKEPVAAASERRSPERPRNVKRLPAKRAAAVSAPAAQPAKTGTDGEWSEF